jgi:hypothetical protein
MGTVYLVYQGDAVPFKMQPRRLPLAKREAVKTEIDRLLNDGIIEPSNGPWASQTVLVTKPDGTSRLIRLQKQLCRRYTIYTSSNEDLLKQTPSVAQK